MYTFFDLWSVILVIMLSVTYYFLVVCLRCRIRHSSHIDEYEEFFWGGLFTPKGRRNIPKWFAA